LLFFFAINFLIVVWQLFFFRRFIISLDVLLVILAGVGVSTFLASAKVPRMLGTVAIMLLLVSSGILVVDKAGQAQPLIDEGQAEAIEWLSQNTEKGAYVLVSSYDAPWVLGWADRKVIAPGLFQWNRHNRARWIEFFSTQDPDTVRGFLDEYGSPLYIFYSQNPGNYLGLEKFDDEAFRKIYDDRAIIYRYLGGGAQGAP
ncbi:MAG: hypothetical protein ACE5IA_00855, partial [Dehalococcoidia bacterium]